MAYNHQENQTSPFIVAVVKW